MHNIILTPTSTVEDGMTLVSAIATIDGVEYPTRFSISAGKHAPRLMKAIAAGRGFATPVLKTDVNNVEYVCFTLEVGRCMNADLKAIGF